MAKKYFHFSIGPVQRFVAQSRRTRDLWAGSYVLSWLIAHAMRTAQCEGGQIVGPYVDDDALKAFVDTAYDGPRPRFGQLPNHFTVNLGDVEGNRVREVAELAAQAVRGAWKHLAGCVYEYIEPAVVADSHSAKIKDLWDRQIDEFGEIHWAVSDTPSSSILHQRKAWRVPSASDECGDPCSVMGSYQELSTYDRAQDGKVAFKAQKRFWECARTQAAYGGKKGISPFDLPEFDRLCAVALVKRLFPMLAKDDERLLGYTLNVKHWPSTAHLAAFEFTEKLKGVDLGGELENYPKLVFRAAKEVPGATLRGAFCGVCEQEGDATFENLGGEYYFESALLNSWTRNAFSMRNGGEKGDALANGLAKQLRALCDKAGGHPSPFYAVLLMDGDHLGNLFHSKNADEARNISQQLAKFCGGVSSVVGERHGHAIYTGGDDVLALLPVSTAVDAARQLRSLYRESLCSESSDATISAGIVFARFNVPLMDVIAEAHHTLDDIAKEEAGRDACAVTVLKSGSDNVCWRGKWGQVDAVLEAKKALEDEHLSRSFTHRMLGIFQKLVRNPKLKNEQVRLPEDVGIQEIIKSEYERSVDRRGDTLSKEEVEAASEIFLRAIEWDESSDTPPADSPSQQNAADDGGKKLSAQPKSYQPSGLLLARFLQQHGGLIHD
ncbi:hypothetical protein JCM16814_30270 [Desulfobaculum senezii]